MSRLIFAEKVNIIVNSSTFSFFNPHIQWVSVGVLLTALVGERMTAKQRRKNPSVLLFNRPFGDTNRKCLVSVRLCSGRATSPLRL